MTCFATCASGTHAHVPNAATQPYHPQVAPAAAVAASRSATTTTGLTSPRNATVSTAATTSPATTPDATRAVRLRAWVRARGA